MQRCPSSQRNPFPAAAWGPSQYNGSETTGIPIDTSFKDERVCAARVQVTVSPFRSAWEELLQLFDSVGPHTLSAGPFSQEALVDHLLGSLPAPEPWVGPHLPGREPI